MVEKDTVKGFVLGVASSVIAGLILFTLIGRAVAREIAKVGEIITTETKIVGCDGECLIGKEIFVFSTFKNIGNFDKVGVVGIKINDKIVKEDLILLGPNEEYMMIYSYVVQEEIPYNICGVVIR